MDVIGNVKNEIVKPPGHDGPSMIGHLIFDADFESGNLGQIRIHLISKFSRRVFIIA